MSDNLITFSNVSRFYGEVLGINKVSLNIPPGITSLVGPSSTPSPKASAAISSSTRTC